MAATGDAVTAFFEEESSRGYEPLLRSVSGTVRFDLVSGKATERWLVTIHKGNLAISRRNGAADTVMRLSRTLFEAVTKGETNILPALLRGEVVLEGDYRLMIMIRRLLRRRLAASQAEMAAAGYARRQK
jgi:putative sterol carrier protein